MRARLESAMTKYQVVQALLAKANGNGSPMHCGKGKFWTKAYQELIGLNVCGQKLIAMGQGAQSNLIKSLKGEKPFDGSQFKRMPENRPPMPDGEILWIQKWIDEGCPNTPVQPEDLPPGLGLEEIPA